MGITAVRLRAQVTIEANAVAGREARFLKNAAATFSGRGRARHMAASTGETVVAIETPRISVVATDFFEVEAVQDSGGALNAMFGNNVTWFGLEVLA
jgi:hypothetical protein